MLTINENGFRDHLFQHYKENLSSIIVGRREPVQWAGDRFPTIRFLLQQRAEKKINNVLDSLEYLVLTAKELRLERNAKHPTRVDLFGYSDWTGMTIIELKKSDQTERQAFTELLAYSNHFCSIFPGLKESAITSVLVAPMETRTVKDAYVQELIFNEKNIIALIPHEKAGKFALEVFYPDSSYYEWFENNILDDSSMMCEVLSFPLIKGWIDSYSASENRGPPQYTIDALNNVANSIAQRLESEGFHALVYATQKWGEIADYWPYPNSIVVAAMNPFSSFRTSVHEGAVYGNSEERRLAQVQSIYDQMTGSGKDCWIDTMESNFGVRLVKAVCEQFELCFLNMSEAVPYELSGLSWYGLKTSFVDAVATHNQNTYLTGLLREIYLEYIQHVYEIGEDDIFYCDDLPKYSCKMLAPFLPIWQIINGLGYGEKD